MRFLLLALLASPAPGQSLQPGEWRWTGRVTSADIPGAPGFLLRMMTSRTQRGKLCLTPDQAANNPQALFDKSKGQCRYTRFNLAGGKMEAQLACSGGRMGQATTIVTTGSYTATSYATSSVITGETRKGEPIRMTAEGAGARSGGCR